MKKEVFKKRGARCYGMCALEGGPSPLVFCNYRAAQSFMPCSTIVHDSKFEVCSVRSETHGEMNSEVHG